MTDQLHDPEWLAECRERAPIIAQEFADQLGRGTKVLVGPGCSKGCPRCVRECAVRHIQADWWTRELAKAEKAAAAAMRYFVHDGVAYIVAGRA